MNIRPDVSSAIEESKIFAAEPLAPEILLVSDNAALRPWLNRVLHGAGYRVVPAGGFRTARLLLAQRAPAAVLTDAWLPDGDGWELLVHCQKYRPQVPVLLMSASAPGLYPHIECWAAGFLAKPFTANVLLSAVARVAPRHRVNKGAPPAGLPPHGPAG